jgi:DNA-binding CsgD family transcriptional regulator
MQRRGPLASSKPDEAELRGHLLPLHAATEVDALWRAVLPLLRAAFAPCVRVTLFLGHFGMREARLVFTDPPIKRPADWYRERGRINPFTPYIRAHRRIPHYVFRDVVGSHAQFGRTEFYRRFARAEGWDKGVSGLFWNGDEVKSMFSVYRAPRQPEFGPAEVRRMEFIRPHIETAIDRVQKLQAERMHRKVLEEFNRYIPVGLVLLDWELETVFTNNEALRQCVVWNHGRQAGRGLASRELFALPVPLRAVCEQIRTEILRSNAKDRVALPPGLRRVAHPQLSERTATVSVLNASPGLLTKPGFMLVFEDQTRASEPGAALAPDKERLLWSLTPSEREIALLVCDGESNQEIARRLNKSLLTIKKQLTSVYAKLGVPSRARLIARVR